MGLPAAAPSRTGSIEPASLLEAIQRGPQVALSIKDTSSILGMTLVARSNC